MIKYIPIIEHFSDFCNIKTIKNGINPAYERKNDTKTDVRYARADFYAEFFHAAFLAVQVNRIKMSHILTHTALSIPRTENPM